MIRRAAFLRDQRAKGRVRTFRSIFHTFVLFGFCELGAKVGCVEITNTIKNKHRDIKGRK